MTIRPLADADVDACAVLMQRLPLWDRYRVTPEDARGLFTGVLAGPSRSRVAEDSGRVVGFVVYSVRGTFDHSGYVRAIGVAEDAQRHGVGGRLMDAAEEEIFSRGPNVFLLVSAFNTAGQRFYARRGYRPIGEIPDYVRTGITEILFRKTLGAIQPTD